jgi:ketosteroid isomerase-like protein
MAAGEEEVREVERQRVAAFVAKDIRTLERLHSEDFELINPGGMAADKAQYIGGIAAGAIEYRVWDIDSEIAVRLSGDSAVVRYRSQIEIVVQGELQPRQRFWHTDTYEKDAGGQWQAVWSQATRIS